MHGLHCGLPGKAHSRRDTTWCRKTEAAKKLLEYITAVSGSSRTGQKNLKEQLLRSNPVLESFGNAKTSRNDNSSRFGKYMQIMFDYGGAPTSASITNYLLEKPRVVGPADGERNYHIFYQILKSLLLF